VKVRAKAPLRLGLAGGGSDVSPYSDKFGGSVLNATINLFARTTISDEMPTNIVIFNAQDLDIKEELAIETLNSGVSTLLPLHHATYNRIMNQFNGGVKLPLEIITSCDSPPGSGLGSSSTLVVSMLEAYRQLMSLPLGEYDIAHLAYEIEREDCGLAGGKQDQYAATFGGFNFIEFSDKDRVIVNPLRIRRHILNELESSMILFYTGQSRDSDTIINDQVESLEQSDGSALAAMHEVKKASYVFKELLLRGDIYGLAHQFRQAWNDKKATSKSITNHMIDELERSILTEGALSMKVSGAGGGGFVIIFVDPEKKYHVIKKLSDMSGHPQEFQFVTEGAISWTV